MQEITELRLAKERWEKAEKLGQEEKATALLILKHGYREAQDSRD
jgi:hypothetical protein